LLDTRSALIIAIIFFFIYFSFFFFLKNILNDIGNERIDANTKRFKVVSEAFEANKEVKTKMLEDFYVAQFEKSAKIYCHNQSLADIISQLPRYFLEILTFGGITLLLLVLMTLNNFNIVEILPIMTMYALAGYRMIPALQQIYSAFSKLKFYSPVLVSLHEQITKARYEFQEFHRADEFQKIHKVSEISFKKSLVLENISFAYPNTKAKSVSHVSLEIEAFQNVGIVGVTGCGKTTLLDIIIGLLDPNEGHIKIDGQKINKGNKSSWMKKIGYVPQQIYLRDATIASNIAFGMEIESLNFEKIKEVAKISKIHDYIVNELPNGYNSTVGERGVQLSGGQKQRIALARALYNEPEILILDEATSSLDNITEKLVMESMNNLKNNITIIQVAHRLNTVKNCDKIFLLEKGKLVAEGKFSELKEYNEIFNKMSSF
jgi:ABC-type bacteriocin/lantibiotic exporter with double-glycine peptidase domain